MAVESREWSKVSEVLTRLRAAKGDPEGLRRGLLAWFSRAMISPKPFFANKRVFAQACVDALRDSYQHRLRGSHRGPVAPRNEGAVT